MQCVEVAEAVGHRLAQPVHDEQGRVLLAQGLVLTEGFCDVLQRRGFARVWVADGVADDVGPRDALRPRTRALAQAAARECYRHLSEGQALPTRRLMAAVDAILEDLRRAPGVAVEFCALQGASDYTYVHSVHVCVYSLLLGESLGLASGELRMLGMGALLHDVGKIFCADLCSKPGKLEPDEWERMKRHTEDGFELLRRHHELHLYAAHIAYQHHERMDGSGYPRGLRGEEILLWARMVAVADVFDAMTAERPYAPGRPRLEAMEELRRGAGPLYDPGVVRLFQDRVAIHPSGSPVLLADGSVAVVVGQTEDPSQPLVRRLGRAGQQFGPEVREEVRAAGPLAVRTVLESWPTWLVAGQAPLARA